MKYFGDLRPHTYLICIDTPSYISQRLATARVIAEQHPSDAGLPPIGQLSTPLCRHYEPRIKVLTSVASAAGRIWLSFNTSTTAEMTTSGLSTMMLWPESGTSW